MSKGAKEELRNFNHKVTKGAEEINGCTYDEISKMHLIRL